MNFELLWLYIISVIVFIITPGPVIALILKNTSSGGFKKAFWTILGTDFGSLILIAFALLGILGIFNISNDFFTIFSFCGAVFIFFLGLRGLVADIGKNSANIAPKAKGAFSAGFILTVSNPKEIIFIMTFLPQFTQILPDLHASLALLVALWVGLDIFVLCAFSFWASKIKALESYSRYISLLSDVILMFVGILGVAFYWGDFWAIVF